MHESLYPLQRSRTDVKSTICRLHLSSELLSEHLLAGITVLGKTSDTLVKLVPSHVVVEQLPSESSLVVDERDLLKLVSTGRRGVELLGDLGTGSSAECTRRPGVLT